MVAVISLLLLLLTIILLEETLKSIRNILIDLYTDSVKLNINYFNLFI